MSRFMESVQTINSSVRTMLLVIFFGAIGFAGWLGYRTFYADEIEAKEKEEAHQVTLARVAAEHEAELTYTLAQQKERHEGELRRRESQHQQVLKSAEAQHQEELVVVKAEHQEELALKDDEILELGTALRLSKFDHRLAEVTVLDVSEDPGTGETISRVEFVEIDNDGTRLEKPRVFDLKGEVVYIDHWVVNFDDKYIEQATDLDRSTALCMFRRIFGESQKPLDGFQLDQNGSRPLSYSRGGKLSELEEKIWSDFWEIANDHKRAGDMGIRAIHGDAVFFKAVKGKRWSLQIRASGKPTLLPARDVESVPINIPAA